MQIKGKVTLAITKTIGNIKPKATRNSGSMFSHWTREHASKIKATPANTIPPFNLGKVLPLMPGYHVWDSWFVMTEDNKVASVKGFTVLIGLVRPIDDQESANARIAYFYSADGVHYEVGGFLFGDEKLFADCQEWSGSTILRKDGKLQTFYTTARGVEFSSGWQTSQRFATAIQNVSLKTTDMAGAVVKASLCVDKPVYHDLLAEPDGFFYETTQQAAEREGNFPTAHRASIGSDQTENSCFRDPHFFADHRTGRKFLIFEANTGSGICPAGSVTRDFVGSDEYEPMYQPTIDDLKANGCVGVFELLNDENTFGEFQAPWLTSNLVTDEIERINIVEQQGHIYLFVVGHGNKNTLVTHNSDLVNRDYMLGFRADKFLGKLTPMNESGIVVQQKSMGAMYAGQEQNQQYTYSWMLVPTDKDGVYNCISYANFSTDPATGEVKPVKTSGPTTVVRINGLESQIIDMKYDLLPVTSAEHKAEVVVDVEANHSSNGYPKQ